MTKVKILSDYVLDGIAYKKYQDVIVEDSVAAALIGLSVATTTIERKVKAIRTITEDYTVVKDDNVIFCDATAGNITITLPLSSTVGGLEFTFFKRDNTANTISIPWFGGTIVLAARHDTVTLVSDGTGNLEYFKITENIA